MRKEGKARTKNEEAPLQRLQLKVRNAIAANPPHRHYSPSSLCRGPDPSTGSHPLSLRVSWYLSHFSDTLRKVWIIIKLQQYRGKKLQCSSCEFLARHSYRATVYQQKKLHPMDKHWGRVPQCNKTTEQCIALLLLCWKANRLPPKMVTLTPHHPPSPPRWAKRSARPRHSKHSSTVSKPFHTLVYCCFKWLYTRSAPRLHLK